MSFNFLTYTDEYGIPRYVLNGAPVEPEAKGNE